MMLYAIDVDISKARYSDDGSKIELETETACEIVRCSECAYHDPERMLFGRGWCRTNVRYTRDDDFCAWAEKD